jgi:anti-anti-sigma factor
MVSNADLVTLILRPAVTHSSWSDIEAYGAEVRAELERRVRPVCLVDLSQLTYMGSAMVALLVRVWKVVQSRDGRMVVVCPHPGVQDVIRLAGLDKIWTVTVDREAAIKRLGLKNGSSYTDVEAIDARRSSGSVRMWYFALGAATVLIILMVVLLVLANRKQFPFENKVDVQRKPAGAASSQQSPSNIP